MKTYLQMDGDKLVEYVEKREYDLLALALHDMESLLESEKSTRNAIIPECVELERDWQQARMLGRHEAFKILISCDPEDFTEDFIGNHSIADTGDYGSHWLEDKLCAFLDAKKPSSLIERLYNSFHEQSYMEFATRDAIQVAYALLKNLEHEGNEKGTRCITCGSHCSEVHETDCVMGQGLAKLQQFIK